MTDILINIAYLLTGSVYGFAFAIRGAQKVLNRQHAKHMTATNNLLLELGVTPEQLAEALDVAQFRIELEEKEK